jgi:hypothetical protein
MSRAIETAGYRVPELGAPQTVRRGKDLIAPASMTRAIYEHQKRAISKTELRIYPDRSHYLCLAPGWEEVADFAVDWAVRNQRGVKPTGVNSQAA